MFKVNWLVTLLCLIPLILIAVLGGLVGSADREIREGEKEGKAMPSGNGCDGAPKGNPMQFGI